MAPPQPANQSLSQRFVQLAQTLQFGWFCGHAVLLLCTLRYVFSYITLKYYSRWAQFSYRTAFVAAAATYGIVVFKGYRTRARQGKSHGPLWAPLADENVQYLLISLIWLFSRQILLALLPFTVYSVFHVLTYTRSNLIPTFNGSAQPQPSSSPKSAQQASALSDTIGKFVKANYDTSMTLVAALELALWFRLLGATLLFQKGAITLFVFYTVFLRARFAQSSFVQGAVREVTARVDAVVQNQSTPPLVRNVWDQLKGLVAKATEATDLRKYTSGPQPQGAGPKKAQ